MLGDALYYPHIDIRDGAWLRTAVLYWNGIRTIAPTSISRPYIVEESRILSEEGFLEPLRCDLHPELFDRLGKRVIALMDQRRDLGSRDEGPEEGDGARHDWVDDVLEPAGRVGREIRRRFRDAHIAPEELSPDLRDFAMRAGLAWMHPAKLSREVRFMLEDIAHREPWRLPLGRLSSESFGTEPDHEHKWLLVDGDFAGAYMSALASLLAKEGDLTTLTDESEFASINTRLFIDDVVGFSKGEKFGAFISLFMESIKIDPSTRIQDMLQFRRLREHQLAELSAQFEELSLKITACEDARELEEQVGRIYNTRIRPKLEALKEELKDSSIQSIWQGLQRAVTISVPAGGALAYLTGFSGVALLGVGAAIAVADVAVMSHLSQRKARRASPYSYLLDIERTFQPPIFRR